jgi:hypothetical protein
MARKAAVLSSWLVMASTPPGSAARGWPFSDVNRRALFVSCSPADHRRWG